MSEQPLNPHALHEEENRLIAQRKEKLAAARAKGNAFPNDFRRDTYAGDILKAHADKTREELEAERIPVRVAGRIMLNRGAFMVIQDMTARIQVYVDRKTLPAETLAEIKTWDLGDIIGAEAPCSAPTRATCSCTWRRCSCSPSRCVRCPTSTTA